MGGDEVSDIQDLFAEAAAIVDEFCAAVSFHNVAGWESEGGELGVTRRHNGGFDVLVWDMACYDAPVEECSHFAGATPERAMQKAIDGMREFIAEQKAERAQLEEDNADA